MREVWAKLMRKGKELMRTAAACCVGPAESWVLQVSTYVAVCDQNCLTLEARVKYTKAGLKTESCIFLHVKSFSFFLLPNLTYIHCKLKKNKNKTNR